MKISKVLNQTKRLAVIFVVFFLVIAALQDFLIFPGVVAGFSNPEVRPAGTLPEGVESFFLQTPDSEKIEVWRYQAPKELRKKEVAIVFHGNGSAVDGFFSLQEWLSGLGITSYAVDYRGYGYSSGWPTEKGIYIDGEAAWDFIKNKEKLSGEDVIVVGMSIGTGPAAKLARDINSKALILFSPYSNLKDHISRHPFYRFVTPLLKYEFPTNKFLTELKDTKIILVHGERDHIFPVSNSYELEPLATELIVKEGIGHNDLFYETANEVGAKILQFLDSKED